MWLFCPKYALDERFLDIGQRDHHGHRIDRRRRESSPLNLAIALGSIVAWVTDHLPAGEPHTNVPCWRSPGRKRCRGDIMGERSDGSSEIVWQCPICGANGVIHGWEGTLWDRGPGFDAGQSTSTQ